MMTVFLSTHILPIVDELADTIGVINDGTLVAEAPPSELKSQADESPDLETAFQRSLPNGTPRVLNSHN